MSEIYTVTRGQYEYAAALRSGARTTRDLANKFCVSGGFAAKMMVALRKTGVIKSTRVKGQGAVYQHELIVSIDEVQGVGTRNKTRPSRVTDAEIEFVAELRNQKPPEHEYLTGQALLKAFQERFPDRKSLKNVIPRAVERGLCL